MQSMMSRRVQQYLSNLAIIEDEEKLREMSNNCEPPQGSGMLMLSFQSFSLPLLLTVSSLFIGLVQFSCIPRPAQCLTIIIYS